MFRKIDCVVYDNGCSYVSFGNGSAYALYYKIGDVEQDITLLQHDVHVYEFEALLEQCEDDSDVLELFQQYMYEELPSDNEW